MAKSYLTRIKVKDFEVDADVQRLAVNRRKVNKMVEEWNPDGLGVLLASKRDNGTLILLDGMHRRLAAQLAEGDDFELYVQVFEGLSKPEEAALFRVRNTTSKPSYVDSFHVRLAEGDQVAHRIKEMIEKYGWKLNINLGGIGAYFNAIAALERIYLLDSESEVTSAERTLFVLHKAWGTTNGATAGALVEGIGMFLARHRGKIDAENLAERLAALPGGPLGLVGSARTLRDAMRTRITSAVAEIITEIYNKHRKTTHVPTWRS